MFVLKMNLMRGRTEEVHPVARAETREGLVALMERERVPVYSDGQWRKSFRQGGPFEWYNPPWGDPNVVGMFGEGIHDVGSEDDWAEDARQAYRTRVLGLHSA